MMNNSISSYILHVSDFHLTDQEEELAHAYAALEALTDKLEREHIKINYLLHTGDIINSADLYEKAASQLECCKDFLQPENGEGKRFDETRFEREASPQLKSEFNQTLEKLTALRFQQAAVIMRKFASRLNISLGNVVICCGNHDVLRPFFVSDGQAYCAKNNDIPNYECGEKVKDTFKLFEDFLDELETANSRKRNHTEQPVLQFELENLNILILNTNWKNPEDVKPGYYCVHCEQVRSAISKAAPLSPNMLSIILAHKPIYEVCEIARLSYRRYIKTPFMADLQEFVGENGIYLCGDKHTRSIVGSFFHDIPHYIGGEPLLIRNYPSGDLEVEYNLLEIVENKLGMERKIHLKSTCANNWECRLRPQDTVVSQLYDLSKISFIQNVFEIIAMPKILHTWENVCQEIYSWKRDRQLRWFKSLDKLYKAICKYRKCGTLDVPWESDETNKNIFVFIRDRLCECIKDRENNDSSNNLLNVRGEYSSGKSTFLGILYIFLLHEYSIGSIDFIPAYFNLENDEVLRRIHSDDASYHRVAKQVFTNFTNRIQKIADKEHQPICYIIDGLDEQDCWSYISEDSIGRGLLDVLAMYDNIYYIMSFSQHRLPCFKNTMPPRTFNDKSDIIYFNPIDVREDGAEDTRFISFLDAFLELTSGQTQQELINAECNIVRKFRRLTVNPGFMYHNYAYITDLDSKSSSLKHENTSVADTYRYYIDRQYELCMQKLGYGFIHYAPAMAFLFSYRGYTYEQFKHLPEDQTLKNTHMIKPICENWDKIYDTFLFIKKQNDAREYLIALHYNRELRYYAEHPDVEIEEDSILNEYISRNIAVLIRKLWSDTNKFVIVCEKLLKKNGLSNCVQSMLIYCLAHQSIYSPLRYRLCNKMLENGEKTLASQRSEKSSQEYDDWAIIGRDDAEKLQCFVNLSLQHTMQLFGSKNSDTIVELFIYDKSFCKYNRQHQMLYYGDLSIQGEEKRHPLNPGNDIVYKGFDFHNCFNSLYVKLNSNNQYPLRTFDMCTLWDLIYSRLTVEKNIKGSDPLNTFFYRDAFKEKADKILLQTFDIFDNYIDSNELSSIEGRYFRIIRCYLGKILKIRKEPVSIPYAEHIKKLLDGFYNKPFWDRVLKSDEDVWNKEFEKLEQSETF